MTRVALAVRRWASRLVRERDLLLRSDRRVHFVRLTTRLQLSLAFVAVSTLLWVGGATYTAVSQQVTIRSGLDELHEIKAAYRDLLSEASAYNSKLSVVSQRFSIQQSNLDQLITKLNLPDQKLEEYLRRLGVDVGEMTQMTAVVRESLARSEADFAKVVVADKGAVRLRSLLRDRRRGIDDKLTETQSALALKEKERATLEGSLQVANAGLAKLKKSRDELRSHVAIVAHEKEEERERGDKLSTEIVRMSEALLAVRSKRDGALRQRTASEARMAALENLLGAAKTHGQRLETQLSGILDQLALQAGEGDEEQTLKGLPVSERVARLLDRLETVYSSEKATLTLYSQRAAAGRADLERVIQMTGLDAATLMSRVEKIPAGLGGPLIAVSSVKATSTVEVTPNVTANAEKEGLADALLNLETQLVRWESLREILRVLPLVAPVDNYHVASGYGVRKDPITKRRAMHYGADLAGWLRSPVFATARGTVVAAGRKSQYGKMVEIDHGYGIRTRYGHFNKVLVTKGQVVDFRHKIGLLGNSGRSTGPHVHYEILFDRKQIDPLKFIEAGRYVSKE